MRRVLAGMVTDQAVLSRVARCWKPPGLFEDPWANMVGTWCVEHLTRYGRAPDGRLRAIYEEWASKGSVDEKWAAGVERFLAFLSDEWENERCDASVLIDAAGRHFNRVLVRRTLEEAGDEDDPERALGVLSAAAGISLGVGAVVEPDEDWDAWQRALDPERQRPLVTYPGALGSFLGGALARDSLVAIVAPDKTWKSWLLLDAAVRAVRQRRRVAYFEVGDLLQDEFLQRLGQRVAGLPRWPCEVDWPVGFDDAKQLAFEKRQFAAGLDPADAMREFRRLCRGRRSPMRLSCHPAGTIDVDGVAAVVGHWSREGWQADVTVIDYADILAPPRGVRETLDQIDQTWVRLRRLSQEQHCLVLTATQASALAYKKGGGPLGKQHFSGRKTKNAHVNAMLAVNASDEDRQRGVVRLNWVVRRNARYSEGKTCLVAGCLDLGRPVVASAM